MSDAPVAPAAVETFNDEAAWPALASGLADVKTFHDARRARLAGEVSEGAQLEIEVMRRRLFGAHRQFRDAILRMPDGQSADVAAALELDAFPVHETLREAIELELHEIAALFHRPKGDA